MKYLKAILLILSASSYGAAQEFTDRELQSLVDAERAFAAMAKEKNTRDAFLYFLSDSAVTSAPGAGPRVGKKHLEEQSPDDSYLHWYPVFTDIASSKDFGFNTGPWEFRQKKSDEKPVAFGQFVSVWKKNHAGEWKVAIDIGIGHPDPGSTPSLTTSSIKLKGLPKKSNADKQALFEFEKKFIERYARQGNIAYNNLLSAEAKFYRTGSLPLTSREKIEAVLKEQTGKKTYAFMGGDMATSGDLAYVYGNATFEIMKDGKPQTRNGSYMRFYKKEDGQNWKIVLDLLTN